MKRALLDDINGPFPVIPESTLDTSFGHVKL